MASDTIHCDRDIVVGPGVNVHSSDMAAHEILANEGTVHHLSGTGIHTGNLNPDGGIRLGLPGTQIAGPIKRIDCRAIFEGYGGDDGFGGINDAVRVDVGGGFLSFGFSATNQQSGAGISDHTHSALVDLPASYFGSAEVWISLIGHWHGAGGFANAYIYYLSFTLHNEPAAGYDAPPDPIPSFILAPPRRQFVYPY